MGLRLGRVRATTRLVVATLLVSGVALVGASPASASGGFVVAPSANPVGLVSAQLVGVSCPTSSDCFAVGSYSNSAGNTSPIIERQVGGAWQIVATPKPPNTNSELAGVSCVSATNCFAVGDSQPFNFDPMRTLIEHWNGVSWSIVASPNQTAQRNYLTGVSCVGAASCFAVGVWGGGIPKTLTERWNGTSWTVVGSPNGSNDGANFLSGVSCSSSSSCFAVGLWQDESLRTAMTLTIRWNGTKWSRVGSPNSARSTWNQFAAVSCVSVTSCYAVGDTENFGQSAAQTLIEKWNGTKWSLVVSPNPKTPTRATLLGISCPSATSCFAVGYSFNAAKGNRTLFEQFANGGWTIQPSANAPGQPNSVLAAVSCKVVENCVAAGYAGPRGENRPLVERDS